MKKLYEKVGHSIENPKQPYLDAWDLRTLVSFTLKRQKDAARRGQTPKEPHLQKMPCNMCFSTAFTSVGCSCYSGLLLVKEPAVRELFSFIAARRKIWEKSATTADSESSDESDLEAGLEGGEEEEELEDDPKLCDADPHSDSLAIIAATDNSTSSSIGMQQKREQLANVRAEIARLTPIVYLACAN